MVSGPLFVAHGSQVLRIHLDDLRDVRFAFGFQLLEGPPRVLDDGGVPRIMEQRHAGIRRRRGEEGHVVAAAVVFKAHPLGEYIWTAAAAVFRGRALA